MQALYTYILYTCIFAAPMDFQTIEAIETTNKISDNWLDEAKTTNKK